VKAAIKFIMTLVGLLLIGANIGTVLLLTQLEGLLRTGITRQAGQILHAEVHLEAVEIDWSHQALAFRGVAVFNPEGFSDREAMHLESVWVRPQWLAIFSRTPVIGQVVIRGARIQLQYVEGKGTNLGAMMAHARAWAEQQIRGEEWVLGRPVNIREIVCDPVEVEAESITPPQSSIALTMNAFRVSDPAGEEAVSGARAIYLVLQNMAKQLGALDGLFNSVRETVTEEASPAPA
jgi:hypothetical protein